MGNFLITCGLRDEFGGVRYYGKTNCNYLVFPNDVIIQNYAFHAKNVMANMREKGWKAEYNRIVGVVNGLRTLLGKPRLELVS